MAHTYSKFKLSSYESTSRNLDRSISQWMAPRPCDRCRKKRIRCDRDLYQCNHCKRHGESCTYTYKCKKRGPKSKSEKDVDNYENDKVNAQKHKEIVYINSFEDLSGKFNKNQLSNEAPLLSDNLDRTFTYPSIPSIKAYNDYTFNSYHLSNSQPLQVLFHSQFINTNSGILPKKNECEIDLNYNYSLNQGENLYFNI